MATFNFGLSSMGLPIETKPIAQNAGRRAATLCGSDKKR
jgi:hypothetical protein